MLRHGRREILALLEQVQDHPDDVVLETLEPFNLHSFTDKLDLKPNPSGDHW